MLNLFRRLAYSTGLLHAPSDPAHSATRPLRVLLVGAMVLPVTLYVVASTISYHQHFDEARDRLRRNLAIVHEHAQKVFETFEFASRYIDEMVGNASDEQIRANEAVYSERLRAMTKSLPQLRDLWIVGADGTPLVSGTVYPMPRLDLSDRNYFKVHHDNLVNGPYVTQVLEARAASTRFFAISRKREINGKFAGVTIVSIAPEYFTEFYSQLPPPGHRDAAARRRRGAGALSGLRPARRRSCVRDSPFMAAVKTQPRDRICHRRRPPSTAAMRIFTYQQLAELPQLYVTVGVERSDVILHAWLLAMARPSDLRRAGNAGAGRAGLHRASPHASACNRR